MLSRSFNHNVMGVSETDSYSQIIEAQAYEDIKLVLIYMNLKSIILNVHLFSPQAIKTFLTFSVTVKFQLSDSVTIISYLAR